MKPLCLFLLVIQFTCIAGQDKINCTQKVTSNQQRLSRSASGPLITVLMNRPDSMNFGYVHPFYGNETTTLVGDSNLSKWFNDAIMAITESNVTAHHLWVIKKLSMTSDTAGLHGFAHIVADLYKSSGTRQLQLLYTADTLINYTITDSVSHAGALNNSLQWMYSRCVQAKLNGNTVLYNEDSLVQAVKNERTFPVFSAKKITRGIYKSYEEFCQNSPSVTEAFGARPDTESVNGSVKLFVMGADSVKVDIEGAWGVCFGGAELYKCENGQLIPIEKSGQNFVVARFLDPYIRKNNAMIWRRVVDRGWPDNANPYERKRSVLLSKGLPYSPVATRIDVVTGELTF